MRWNGTVIEIRIDNPKNIKELDLFLLPFGTRDPYPVINAQCSCCLLVMVIL
jgi:hypothetical protein